MIQYSRSLCLVLYLSLSISPEGRPSWLSRFLVSPSFLLPFDLSAPAGCVSRSRFLAFFFFPARYSSSRCSSPTYVVSPNHLMIHSCTSASQGGRVEDFLSRNAKPTNRERETASIELKTREKHKNERIYKLLISTPSSAQRISSSKSVQTKTKIEMKGQSSVSFLPQVRDKLTQGPA